MAVSGDSNIDVQNTLVSSAPSSVVVSGESPPITKLVGIVYNANIDTGNSLTASQPPSEVPSGAAPSIVKKIGVVANANIDTSDYFLNGYGVVGRIRGYDKGFIAGDLQLSFDEFTTIAKTYSLTSPTVLVTVSPPDDLLKGENIGTWLLDYKFIPATGAETVSLNNPGIKVSIDIGYGRLTIYIKTANGQPYQGDNIYVEELGKYLITDSEGKAILDGAGTYTLKVLKESKEVSASVTEFAETVITYYFAGFEITVLGAGNEPLEGVLVTVDTKKIYSDSDGKVYYYEAPVKTPVTIQAFDITKTVTSGDERDISPVSIGGYSVASVRGKITDEFSGEAIADLVVSFDNIAGHSKTNIDGYFAVIIATPGTYKVLIDGGNRYEDREVEVTASSGKVTSVEITTKKRVMISEAI